MKRTALSERPAEPVSHNPAITKRVMLRNDVLPHLTNFSQAEFLPGQVAAAHAHADMGEVFFVESGDGAIAINGIEYALAPGVCVAVEPGEVHEVKNTGDVPLVLTYFGIKI
ncbi:MAG: cupin domain-containing protein [Synechococcales cyanobacterium T60_A2020_003]|nr:cupin domain-containing protein [Synechococcales cyanobacterium T60_A2020_003]